MIVSPWTSDRVETLLKLAREGFSASQIARELNCGITRNAVIGKLYRLGHRCSSDRRRASAKAAGQASGISRRARATYTTSLTPSPIKVSSGRVYHMPPTLPTPRLVGAMTTTPPKPWTKRLSGECTWPVSGEGADTFSCSAPVSPGTCWCDAHNRVGRSDWNGKGHYAAPNRFISETVRRFA